MLRAASNAARATALAEVFGAFQLSLDTALQHGAVQLAAPLASGTPGAVDEVSQGEAHYAVDLEARKAGLRARLANFQREEAEWQELLHKAEQLDAQLAAGAEAGDPSSACKGAVDAAAQQQLPEGLDALERTQRDLHRQLALQVDGLCKLVGDVEELMDCANRSAQTTQVGGTTPPAGMLAPQTWSEPLLHPTAGAQAEYHKEKFRVFPHVDSPARLIRELVKPAPLATRQQNEGDAPPA